MVCHWAQGWVRRLVCHWALGWVLWRGCHWVRERVRGLVGDVIHGWS